MYFKSTIAVLLLGYLRCARTQETGTSSDFVSGTAATVDTDYVDDLLASVDAITSVPVSTTSEYTATDTLSVAEESKPNATEKKWISEMFDEAKLRFDMHANVSAKCKRDYETYKLHLRNQTVWAVRMKESAEWPAVGIFAGNSYHFGDYPECLKAHGPGVKPKYCIIAGYFRHNDSDNVKYDEIANSKSMWNDWPKENVSVWDVINEYDFDRMRASRRYLMWSMCIPTSCKAGELQLSIVRTLKPIFKDNGLYGMIMVSPELCREKELRKYSSGYHIVKNFFLMLAVLVVSATVYENVTQMAEDSAKGRKAVDWRLEMFKCFSAKRSCQMLTHSSKNVFPILYLFKVCFIFGVIIGHEFMFFGMIPRTDIEFGELGYKPWSMEILYSTLLNGFIMISGFLMFYFGIPPAKKLGISWVVLSVVCRWLRLVPVLGIMILIWTFILPYIGDGPIWDLSLLRQVEQCKTSWWTNLLTVNNFINNFEDYCMGHSWYISVDFQLSVVGSLLVFVLTVHEKVGTLVMLLAFVGTFVTSILRVYKNDIYGITLVFPNLMTQLNALEHVRKVYPMMYFWAPPYLVGCAAAIVTLVMKSKNIRLSTLQKTVCLLAVFIIGFGIHSYTFVFYIVGRPFDAFENGIYGSLRQIAFAIPLACLLCVYFTSGLGIFNCLFELQLYVPLGRLVYCIYLISLQIQIFHFASITKSFTVLSRTDVYWRAVTDIVYSVVLAFFIFLISEGPFSSILSLLRPWSLKLLLNLLGTFPHNKKNMLDMMENEKTRM